MCLRIPAPVAGDSFGWSLNTVHTNYLAVGSGWSTGHGLLHLFESSGRALATVTNPVPADGSYSFDIAAMEGPMMAVGAPRLSPFGIHEAGAIFIYSLQRKGYTIPYECVLHKIDQTDTNASNNGHVSSLLVGAEADLSLSKSVNTPLVSSGGSLVYTLVVSNAGPNETDGVVVREQLPPGLETISSESTSGVYFPVGNTWILDPMAAGTSATLTLTVRADYVTTSPTSPLQHTLPTTFADDKHGWAVAALGSDRFAVTARERDVATLTDVGEVYLYATDGTLLSTLTNPSPDAADYFGGSIAALGTDRIIVGADRDDPDGFSAAGVAYLFDTNGLLLTTFTNPSPGEADFFGNIVASFQSDYVLVGAYVDDSDAMSSVGRAYLYDTNAMLLVTFTNPIPDAYDHFRRNLMPSPVPIHIAIGAPYGGRLNTIDEGIVYVFDTNGVLTMTITNPTEQAGARFGQWITPIGTDRLVIGSPGARSHGIASSGLAYLYRLDGTLLTTFTNIAPAGDDTFGSRIVAMGEDRVAIQAWNDDRDSVVDVGSVYIFDTNAILLATVPDPAPAPSDTFGQGLAALSRDRLLVGVPNRDNARLDQRWHAARLHVPRSGPLYF